MWPSKTALLAILGGLGILGWGIAFWALRRPIPSPTEVVRTQVEYRDKIVTQKVVQTVTRPDGTKIETRTESAASDKSRISEKITVVPSNRKWGLGLSTKIGSYGANFHKPAYQLDIARNMWGDVWLTGSLDTEKNVAIGFRLDF